MKKHTGRIWYIEPLTNNTNRWVFENLSSIDRDSDLLLGAAVEINEGGKKKVVKKNLIQVTEKDLVALRRHEEKFKLIFNVFMRESRGAKIQPWTMVVTA